MLSQSEAWELMVTTGPQLVAAGFDVRVPSLSLRKPTPSLRVYADASTPLAVGASRLANVRWSAVFDDVELSADEIRELARQARPLIRSGGRWVAVDRADLAAAAAALEERSKTARLTGAEMLRLALGLEGSPLAGGVTVGRGWAADLMKAAATVEVERVGAPPGFVGELRSYQATALAWLSFLDSVGLGGCLALDMGLGKTPTVLAQLLAGRDNGPALVIAPAAVVGNWAAEAARFTPSLRVVVHHGADRASADEIAVEIAGADVVITTYATAVRDIEGIEAVDWDRVVLDEAQTIKNAASETSQQLRRIPARVRLALTGTPIENGLGDLWSILDFVNPGLVGPRPQFIAQLSQTGRAVRVEAEDAMRALNGVLVFRRTKAEPAIAAELPDRIDELDHCVMTPEQIGLYQAVLDALVTKTDVALGAEPRKGQILAAITALKQICNHPAAYEDDGRPLAGRSGKLARLEEIIDAVFAAGERVLVFTHFAEWGTRLAEHLTARTGTPVACYHGGLSRTVRDRMVEEFQRGEGPGALVLSLKAGGTGLNLTAASHVVLFDRWWNPAVEDQARDRAWRIGQDRTVICHRLVCPGTVDERVEEVVAGKRHIADLVLPKSSSLADLDSDHLRVALGIHPQSVLTEDLESDEEAVA
jgi:SNF2 family DNA or RNA helicase